MLFGWETVFPLIFGRVGNSPNLCWGQGGPNKDDGEAKIRGIKPVCEKGKVVRYEERLERG